MNAHKGDRLLMHGRIVGQPDRVGEIVEVMGAEGEPPYRVRLEDGETIGAKAVVVAADPVSAVGLLPGIVAPRMNRVTCLYFAAPEPPVEGPWLVLNGEGRGLVNNVAVMSEVSRSYAPEGQSLVSVSVLGEALEAAARCLGVGPAFDQVVPADHLGPYEAVGDVGVNRSRRVERRQAVAERPRPRLLVAGREKADEVERGEEAADDILERRGALAVGRGLLVREVGQLGLEILEANPR